MINIIYNNKHVQKLAYWVVKKKQLLANPDLYFECKKRTINERVFLDDNHLRNCKVLSSREYMLELMPQNAICAEVGVAEGYFSDKILKICKPKKLYMIEYDEANCKNLKKRFEREINQGTVELLQGDSVEMLRNLPDASLDFVYLDATHDYEHPSQELKQCKKKVKKEGYICGHDYTRFSMWEQEQYGVIEAVNEFMMENDYEMKYLTMDMLHSNASYVIQKM